MFFQELRMYQRFSSRNERLLISFFIAIGVILAVNDNDDLLDYAPN